MSAVARSARRAVARWSARRYVAGPDVGDALAAARLLEPRGFATAIGFWDGPEETPETVRDRNLAAVTALERSGLDCYLSLKAKALGFDPAYVVPVLEAASRAGVRVHFDSLEPDGVDRSLALAEEGLRLGGRIGFTLPGRWRRSRADAQRLIELAVPVRVVKGERTEQGLPAPVGTARRDDFLGVVDVVAGRAPLVAVATHDAVLARPALERLRAAATPAELELLYAFPFEPALSVARELSVPVRVYVGFGYPWLPYGLRDLRQGRVLGWFVRDVALGRRAR